MAIKLTVYNDSKITEKEIREFLALLPPRYTNLDVTITVYGSRIKWWFMRETGASRRAFGDYRYVDNTINVYAFKYAKEPYHKLRILDTLLHELRHAYQAIYHKDRFLYDHSNYVSSTKGEEYAQQWIETDARKFSRRVLNLYRDEINRIIGHDINDHWRIYESS